MTCARNVDTPRDDTYIYIFYSYIIIIIRIYGTLFSYRLAVKQQHFNRKTCVLLVKNNDARFMYAIYYYIIII